MQINFSKMHGLENDFIVLNNITGNLYFTPQIIQYLSHRRTGIGFDQLLMLESPIKEKTDFHYRIFNANGMEVSQCGNGARCLALFLILNKIVKKKIICVSTNTRIIILRILKNQQVCVDMGVPLFQPQHIPYLGFSIENYFSTSILGKTIKYYIASMGNPHCIIIVKDIKNYPVKEIGSMMSIHKLFPKGVNVGFMEIVSTTQILLRVYERGVGETRSCGSGACAAVAVGIKEKILSSKVQVDLLGGKLKICWNGRLEHLYMIGSATHVYDGCFCL